MKLKSYREGELRDIKNNNLSNRLRITENGVSPDVVKARYSGTTC